MILLKKLCMINLPLRLTLLILLNLFKKLNTRLINEVLKKINDAAKKYLILVDQLNITDYNAKINEVERKILSITGLATLLLLMF